jgi:methionyl-tRNA formyltransferase
VTICIAGKHDIAVAALQAILQRFDPSGVLVVPNRDDSGEDRWQRSLRKAAADSGVRTARLEDAYDLATGMFLSLECDRLVRPERFRTHRVFNLHFSLLPKYRGMYTSVWPILNGESESGVTLHWIDSGIDTGDIIAQERFPLELGDTARDLYFKYMSAGTALVLRHVDALIAGEVPRCSQPPLGASYYSKRSIDFSNLSIDLNKTAFEVHNQIRAFTFKEYQLPRLLGHLVVGSEILSSRSVGSPGSIAREDDRTLVLRTVDYDLMIHKQA